MVLESDGGPKTPTAMHIPPHGSAYTIETHKWMYLLESSCKQYINLAIPACKAPLYMPWIIACSVQVAMMGFLDYTVAVVGECNHCRTVFL